MLCRSYLTKIRHSSDKSKVRGKRSISDPDISLSLKTIENVVPNSDVVWFVVRSPSVLENVSMLTVSIFNQSEPIQKSRHCCAPQEHATPNQGLFHCQCPESNFMLTIKHHRANQRRRSPAWTRFILCLQLVWHLKRLRHRRSLIQTLVQCFTQVPLHDLKAC